jgi:hypothetical protein
MVHVLVARVLPGGAAGAARRGLPLGPASLPEARSSEVLAPGLRCTKASVGRSPSTTLDR